MKRKLIIALAALAITSSAVYAEEICCAVGKLCCVEGGDCC